MTNRRSRILQSPKLAQKKRKKLIITSLLSFVCTVLFIFVIIMLFRLSFLQVSTIDVVGNTTINANDVKQIATLNLEGEYFGIIPKSSIFFYSKSDIKSGILDKYKKIDSIHIKKHGLSGLQIVIREKETVAIVCNGFHSEEQSIDKECYSVDKDGYVFEESLNISEGVYPHYYIDLDNKEGGIIGSSFVDKEIFSKLQSFIDIVRNARIHVIGLLVDDKYQYELYIKNIDDSEAIVYFDNKIPFEKTASNLILFLNDIQIKNKNSKKAIIFDYINLRFGNNIFYVTK